VDTAAEFHEPARAWWARQAQEAADRARTVPDRYAQVLARLREAERAPGDALVERVRDLFHQGMGVRWDENQVRVFDAFLGSCLPLVYGETWATEKARVLRAWGLDREIMYSLVNMARRNGKTYVTSGTAAALLLCVPNIKIAVFSTCKRTSQMMLEAILDRLEQAFNLGTHVDRQDYVVTCKNKETVAFVGPDGTPRHLGSYPGSVRVSVPPAPGQQHGRLTNARGSGFGQRCG
jgi:hypothetical protein